MLNNDTSSPGTMSRPLVIAAEHDHTPLAEKREFAARMHATVAVVRGSRHGTPFDASEATNASLLALLTDQPLPAGDQLTCDAPARAQALSLVASMSEECATAVAPEGGRSIVLEQELQR
jgi:hypothetical protein